jgi:hypothetical protein
MIGKMPEPRRNKLQDLKVGERAMEKLRDLVYLCMWVFSYRAIVLAFQLIRRLEGKRKVTGRPTRISGC